MPPSPNAPPPVKLPDALYAGQFTAHRELFTAVYDALYALPSLFKTDLTISGVLATDLFTFNTSLGATIEAQVVEALNAIRSVWDPEQKYALYSFVRQAQRFPDVILRTAATGQQPQILMGIELKGWYVLAKEKEPSFRYKVTPAVCAPPDMLVVYPWALSNVISGSPRLFQPYVQSARYAAAYRNWHWQYEKAGGAKNALRLSTVNHYYPAKGDEITDRPANDNGGNFGRFARTGLMDAYMEQVHREKLSGIPLTAWQRFLALFSEDKTEAELNRGLDRLEREVRISATPLPAETIDAVRTRLSEIVSLLSLE